MAAVMRGRPAAALLVRYRPSARMRGRAFPPRVARVAPPQARRHAGDHRAGRMSAPDFSPTAWRCGRFCSASCWCSLPPPARMPRRVAWGCARRRHTAPSACRLGRSRHRWRRVPHAANSCGSCVHIERRAGLAGQADRRVTGWGLTSLRSGADRTFTCSRIRGSGPVSCRRRWSGRDRLPDGCLCRALNGAKTAGQLLNRVDVGTLMNRKQVSKVKGRDTHFCPSLGPPGGQR